MTNKKEKKEENNFYSRVMILGALSPKAISIATLPWCRELFSGS